MSSWRWSWCYHGTLRQQVREIFQVCKTKIFVSNGDFSTTVMDGINIVTSMKWTFALLGDNSYNDGGCLLLNFSIQTQICASSASEFWVVIILKPFFLIITWLYYLLPVRIMSYDGVRKVFLRIWICSTTSVFSFLYVWVHQLSVSQKKMTHQLLHVLYILERFWLHVGHLRSIYANLVVWISTLPTGLINRAPPLRTTYFCLHRPVHCDAACHTFSCSESRFFLFLLYTQLVKILRWELFSFWNGLCFTNINLYFVL